MIGEAGATLGVLGVVGDIGGTNARFSLVAFSADEPSLALRRAYRCEDFPNVDAALAHYFDDVGCARPPGVVLATAGPVNGGEVQSTNGRWRISQERLLARGYKFASVINDFEAMAIGAAGLGPSDFEAVGALEPKLTAQTRAVIGAGTGFGAAALAFTDRGYVPLVAEGGHIGFSPSNETEIEILRILQRRYGRVSIERVLSGPGLQNIYEALGECDSHPKPAPTPETIAALGTSGEDPRCIQALDLFCAVFGSVAGDFALSYGAVGGVFLAGGLTQGLTSSLKSSVFRQRFEDKGRLREYMRNIPTIVITHPYTALLGAAKVLRDASSGDDYIM